MDHELLLARSITQAQHMVRALGGCGIRSGIRSRIFRAPRDLTDRGCAYAVRLRPGTLEQALSCLKSAGITPLAVYRHMQEGYREAAE